MGKVSPNLAGHPDRLRWNARYEAGAGGSFRPHPLAELALSLPLPDGPVLDLACGPSGGALLAAAAGRPVTAVDARRRGIGKAMTLVHADLGSWRPRPGGYSLVLCTGYWDRLLFAPAAAAVAPGGLLAWEAFTTEALRVRPGLCAEWCLEPGEPAELLPTGFTVLSQSGQSDKSRGARQRLLARHGP